MTHWLDIIGVGEGPVPESLAARLATARTIIGPRRLVDRLAPPAGPDVLPLAGTAARWLEWRSPLDSMLAQLDALRHTPTIVLASGDPMWFGIGATLAGRYPRDEFTVHAHPSAFQLAAARLHWPLQHVATLSLHGRPSELILPLVTPGQRILALTTDRATAPHVARLLTDRLYGRSIVTVLESLGGSDERIAMAQAAGFDLPLGDFYVLAVECLPEPGAPLVPPVPGLPDEAFVSDGQLTKREVRAATLAKLAPYPGALLWDIGAGSGAIAIEWMRAARDARAIAFERESERLQMIAINAGKLGVPTLRIADSAAPASFAGHHTPDAIFIGGDVGNETLFHAAWSALRPGGRLVANAVTLDGEAALYDRHDRLGGDLVRIDVAVLDRIGAQRVMRPRMAVTQWSVSKP